MIQLEEGTTAHTVVILTTTAIITLGSTALFAWLIFTH